MEDSETVMEYVNRLVEVENDLAGVGHLLDQKEKIRALLRGLSENFEVTAKVTRAMNMSFTKAVSELVVEEVSRTLQNVEASGGPSTALSTIQHDDICSHCGRKGHNADQCFHNPRSKGYRKDFCKKKGRMNNRRSSTQKSKHVDKKQGDGSKDSADVALVSKSVLRGDLVISESMKDKWMVDSAATSHICNDESL